MAKVNYDEEFWKGQQEHMCVKQMMAQDFTHLGDTILNSELLTVIEIASSGSLMSMLKIHLKEVKVSHEFNTWSQPFEKV